MPNLLDILKGVGGGLAQTGLGGLGALGNALQQQGNPQAFAQEQENQRQAAQLKQQMAMRMMISPYEQAQLDAESQRWNQQAQWHQDEIESQRQAHDEANQRWLSQGLSEGNVQLAHPDEDGAFQVGQSWVKPTQRQKFQVPKEMQDLGFPAEVDMSKENMPVIGDITSLFRQQKQEAAKASKVTPQLRQSYHDQINQLFQDTDATQQNPLAVSIPSGGIAGRHNNPFNLKFAGQPGASPGEPASDGGQWARFQTPESGWQAGVDQVGMDIGRGLTLGQYITKFAPPSSNDTAAYIRQASQAVGANPETPLAEVDTGKLLDFQAKKESGATKSGGGPVATPENAQYRQLYTKQIDNLLDGGDLTRADTLMNTLTDARRKEQTAVRQSAEQVKAKDAQEKQDAEAQFPDWKLDQMMKQVQLGRIAPADAERQFGITSKAARNRWVDYWTSHGYDFPVSLDGASRQNLAKMEPVLDSLKLLKADMAPYAKDNRIARFLLPRAAYAFGYTGREKDGTDWGPTISTGEMDRLRGVAQSLAGLRTALPIFEQGQIHTPNFWKDSGKTANDKLDAMIKYLENNVQKIYKYGQKSGVVVPESMLNSTIQGVNQGGNLLDRLMGRQSTQPSGDLRGVSNEELFRRLGGTQ